LLEAFFPACFRRVVILLATFCCCSFPCWVIADDFKTIEGKEYKNMTVNRVEPDGIILTSKSGIVKLYFAELPKDVQDRFHYNAAAAKIYSDQQNANLERLANQQGELKRQADEARSQANQYEEQQHSDIAQQKAARQAAQNAQVRAQELQARYNELQTDEDALLIQIGTGQVTEPAGKWNQRYVHPNVTQLLPFLESRLNDVRQEKEQIRRELQQINANR
jgi:hypothetical protein